jgi:hypothetical protein
MLIGWYFKESEEMGWSGAIKALLRRAASESYQRQVSPIIQNGHALPAQMASQQQRLGGGALRGRGWVIALAVIGVFLIATGSMKAQEATGQGRIDGRVTDKTNAVVTGAKVTITNTSTNVALSVVTNNVGDYQLINLNPGPYSVTVAAPGFNEYLQEGIILEADAHVTIDVSLTVGRANQVTVVTADVSLLNTESGPSAGQVFNTRELESLPAQNETYLAQLAPGVISNLPQNQAMVGNTNGQAGASQFGAYGRIYANDFLFDGMPNQATRNIAYTPDTDELGHIVTVVGGFDGTVGHTYGVQLLETTKAGTNQFHGSLTAEYWDYRWQAMFHFQRLNDKYQQSLNNCAGKPYQGNCLAIENKFGWPGLHENRDSFGIGGPVIIPKLFNGRNKLFFFVSGLDDNYAGDTSSTISIPTQQELAGNFSDMPVANSASTPTPAAYASACPGSAYYGQYQIYNPFSVNVTSGTPSRAPFCGNIIPSNLLLQSPLVKVANASWPTPTNGSTTGDNYVYGQLTTNYNHRVTGRIDYTPSQQDRIFARYTWMHQQSTSDEYTSLNNEVIGYFFQGAAVGWTHVLGANTVLDVTLGAETYGQKYNFPVAETYNPTQLGLPSYVGNYAGQLAMFPIITFGSAYNQISNADINRGYQRSGALRVNVTHVQGSHSSVFGGEVRLQGDKNGGPGNPSGTYAFDDTFTQGNNNTNTTTSSSPLNNGLSYAAFLLGVDSSATATLVPAFSRSTPYFAAFANDTWRATPKLTIVAGLRYEFEYGPTDKQNQQIVGWDPTASLPIAAPANAAYQAALATATAAERAVLPQNLTIQGGPIYAGVNGASTRAWVNDYRIMPRFSMAYRIKQNTVVRAGYGLFFDTLNALGEQSAIDQDGFTASTSVSNSNGANFGTTFTPAAPPITNPFPSENGTNFNTDIGSSAGAMYYVGSAPSPGIYDHSRVPAREQRGQVSVQHQFGQATVVELAWAGSLTADITLDADNAQTGSVGAQKFANVPASFYAGGTQPNHAGITLLSDTLTNPFAIGNFGALSGANPVQYNLLTHSTYFTTPTISIANLVKSYPQMSGLTIFRSTGESKFQSFQLTVTRRLAKGLSFVGALQINDQHDRDYFANPFDTSPSWESTNLSRPYRGTALGVYDLPFGRNHRWANTGWKSAVFGGFRMSGTYEIQPGALLTFPNSFYIGNTSAIQLKHSVEFNNLASGGSAYIQAFNTGNVISSSTNNVCTNTGTGFVTNDNCTPNIYNLRVFPTHIEGIRQEGPDTFYAALIRQVHVTETTNLELRFDCFNVFNRLIVGAADTNPSDTQFGQVTSDGTGYPRWMQVQARYTF